MSRGRTALLVVALLVGRGAMAQTDPVQNGSEKPSPADRITESVEQEALQELLQEVLERNPGIAAARARAQAAAARAPQVAALPDPSAGLTGYLETPETRVGPQRLMAMLSQKVPWFGKLALREKAALLAAAASEARVEAGRLSVLTEARRLYYEIGFLDALARVTSTDLETLRHYEELARARYESGVGLEQGVIKLQAEITKDETKLLQIAENRAALVAALNALRDRPDDAEIPEAEMPELPEVELEPDHLRSRALGAHPELIAADAEIQGAQMGIDLAKKGYKPDFNFALTYGFVDNRDDPAGIANPPPDNGQDILGVSATINVPLWTSKLRAGVVEATEKRVSQEEQKRGVVAGIDRSLADLTSRIPLLWRQLRLLEDVLSIQAEQSLNSAEAAYSAGSLNALDLLDAERVLLEVRISTARTLADYAIRLAELEAAVAGAVQGRNAERE